MSTHLILPLDTEHASLEAAGGKGMNLACMVRAGFPVPGGFIITTAAYDAFTANGLTGWILDVVSSIPPDDPQALEAASATIRARFAAGQTPHGLTEALCDAYAALGRPAVAVRSSATAEDLPGMSFAGQQDTYLNIVGEDALQKAVVDCWSSLWSARAIGYRARNGILHKDVSLAVVVQEMVPGEASGVLFTADPLGGKRTEVVIEATLGLGEALVSGQVEPDRYVVDAVEWRILEKTLGSKAIAIRGRAGGGTITVEEDAAACQALPDEAILELARLGWRAADHFGTPQDVEWARADGRLFLLQSRPITSLYPLPDDVSPEPLRVMFSFGAMQGMLDPMTPLGRDAMCAALVGGARSFGYSFTVETQPVLKVAGERLWVDLAGLVRNRIGRRLSIAALGYITPGAQAALKSLIEQGRFPPPGPLSARTALRLVWVMAPVVVRALRTLLRPDAEREALFRQLERLVDDFEARFAATATLGERMAVVRETANQAFEFVLPQFVPRFGMGMATYNLLTQLAASLPDGAHDTQTMMRGMPHNVTTDMDLALWQAAQAIRADAPSAARFEGMDVTTLAADYLAGRLPERSQEAVDAFLSRYGARGLGEIDLGRPRWREDPTPVMQTLRSYLQVRDADGSPDAVYERGRAVAEAEIDRLVAALRRTPGGRIKARLAGWAARRMRALVGLRESPKFAIIRRFGLVREAMLADGQALVKDGVLDRPEDVFFLHMAELEALAAARQRDWAALVRERRRAYERECLRVQIPRLLLSDGSAFYAGVTASDGERPAAAGPDAIIAGSPVSPGVVEGVVCVVLDPRRAQLAPGEILVCPGTDPSWTPLFLVAGGLVMEVGGMMTHGSVVAREYGIPAVVGVHEATQRLETGQRIRVDGSAGTIVILSDAV